MSGHRVYVSLALVTALVAVSCSAGGPGGGQATPAAGGSAGSPATTSSLVALPTLASFRPIGEEPGDDVTLSVGDGQRIYVATSWGFALYDPSPSSSASVDHCAPGAVGELAGPQIQWRPAPGSVQHLVVTGSVLVGVGLTPDCVPAAFRSRDGGRTWSTSPQSPDFRPVTLLAVPDGSYLASGPAGLWASRDGRSWIRRGSPMVVLGVTSDGLLVSSDGRTIATSSDQGSSWKSLPGVTVPTSLASAAVGDRGLLLGTDDGVFWLDLASPGPPRQLSTGRVVATAAAGALLAALEVTPDGLALDLLDETGQFSSRRIELPGVTASVALGGALGLIDQTLVLALVDPQAAETVRVFSAGLSRP